MKPFRKNDHFGSTPSLIHQLYRIAPEFQHTRIQFIGAMPCDESAETRGSWTHVIFCLEGGGGVLLYEWYMLRAWANAFPTARHRKAIEFLNHFGRIVQDGLNTQHYTFKLSSCCYATFVFFQLSISTIFTSRHDCDQDRATRLSKYMSKLKAKHLQIKTIVNIIISGQKTRPNQNTDDLIPSCTLIVDFKQCSPWKVMSLQSRLWCSS